MRRIRGLARRDASGLGDVCTIASVRGQRHGSYGMLTESRPESPQLDGRARESSGLPTTVAAGSRATAGSDGDLRRDPIARVAATGPAMASAEAQASGTEQVSARAWASRSARVTPRVPGPEWPRPWVTAQVTGQVSARARGRRRGPGRRRRGTGERSSGRNAGGRRGRAQDRAGDETAVRGLRLSPPARFVQQEDHPGAAEHDQAGRRPRHRVPPATGQPGIPAAAPGWRIRFS